MLRLPPSSTPPHTGCRFASAARTCEQWRSACSSSTPATEVCDDRSHRNRIAGGVALPQPGQHVSDLPRQVVLPLSRRLERTSHGGIGTGQSISRDIGTEL